MSSMFLWFAALCRLGTADLSLHGEWRREAAPTCDTAGDRGIQRFPIRGRPGIAGGFSARRFCFAGAGMPALPGGYRSSRSRANSSAVKPACLIIAWSVPLGIVLLKWIGTVRARWSAARYSVRWLPFCRYVTNPALSRRRTSSRARNAGDCLDMRGRHVDKCGENGRGLIACRNRLSVCGKIFEMQPDRLASVGCGLRRR